MGETGISKMGTISVAMAVYNGSRFINEQLDSIIDQLEESDELIISYDESSDDTFSIITEYSERFKQVRVVKDPGRGVFSNFENAIRNASGDYIFISDQDDIWAAGKREKIVRDFERTKVDMVIHNAVHIDVEGNEISNDFFSTFNIRNGIIRNFLKPRYSGCCIAFRKKMKKLLIPIPRKVGAYDHWIGMVGEVFGSVYFEPGVYLKHRIHGNNVTVTRRSLITIMKVRCNLLMELIKLRRRVS